MIDKIHRLLIGKWFFRQEKLFRIEVAYIWTEVYCLCVVNLINRL
ncbi:hypothetical protein [uncultured Gammaproteobacteria bacterium]|nr:hypothetical protein [uncultured Gammaproteobacteria bacterium]CAC9560036.1 hypothetical protein [uncultured Gammaproteobacteria bacterium]